MALPDFLMFLGQLLTVAAPLLTGLVVWSEWIHRS